LLKFNKEMKYRKGGSRNAACDELSRVECGKIKDSGIEGYKNSGIED
jgi:hypothetical protein